MKVLSGKRDGDTVKLEIEPAKGGEKEELEADVVLVSAGELFHLNSRQSCSSTIFPITSRAKASQALDECAASWTRTASGGQVVLARLCCLWPAATPAVGL